MGSLLNFAISALATSTRRSVFASFTGQMAAAVLFAGFAVLLAVVALGCACAALWIALMAPIGPVGASLVVAGACLVLAGFLALVAWLLMRRTRPRPGDVLDVETLLAEAGRYVNEHKGAALLAATLAGVLAGNSGRKR
jgi:hypothetical protein